jgi:hypothetical protein
MKKLWMPAMLVLGFASVSAAQGEVRMRTPTPSTVATESQVDEQKLRVMSELRAKMAVEAKITPGAPYSAEAVTETAQTLADGNRINRKSVTRVYRDNDGRTRREDVDDSGAVVNVSIVDPIAHQSYVLDPSSRTAYRNSFLLAAPALARSRDAIGAAEAVAKMEGEMVRKRVMEEKVASAGLPPPPPPAPPAAPDGPPKPPPPPPAPETRPSAERAAMAAAVAHEDLGRQNIEGVSATGTRSITTIPTGAIGNMQPIKVVNEQWFSPDLQVLVMTKHSDPRSGETTYRLQSIIRAEPDRSLFTVPADYTLKESGIRELVSIREPLR